MSKKKAGRKTKITKFVLQKLEFAWSIGCTDKEACLHAGISTSALYEFQSKRPEFLERKSMLKMSLVLKARMALANDIGNIDTAKWLLERRMAREFNPKFLSVPQDQDGEEGPFFTDEEFEEVKDILGEHYELS